MSRVAGLARRGRVRRAILDAVERTLEEFKVFRYTRLTETLRCCALCRDLRWAWSAEGSIYGDPFATAVTWEPSFTVTR